MESQKRPWNSAFFDVGEGVSRPDRSAASTLMVLLEICRSRYAHRDPAKRLFEAEAAVTGPQYLRDLFY